MLEAQDANKAGAQLEAQAQKITELKAQMAEFTEGKECRSGRTRP